MRPRLALLLPLCTLLGSCLLPDAAAPSSGLADTGTSEVQLVPLEGARLLRRMSLDLRGELPAVDEMRSADTDPDSVGTIRASFFEDPRFEEQLVYLLAEHFLTVPDTYVIGYYEYGLEEELDYRWKRSIGQEPLRLMARVIAEDEHWSTAVTADYTMATEVTAELWPLEGYPEGETGWHPVTWTDGRPAAGVLATNGMWWRYLSDDYNLNRSRVAAITRLLTCEDLLSRDVTFDNAAALLDAESVAEMVQTEDSCLACHSTVEPMAAALFGFRWVTDYGVQEMERYHPERELGGERALDVTMAYWGEPITGLEDLGQAIGRDERYYRCAAEMFTGVLLRRQLELSDRDEVDDALRVLYDSRGRVWPMLEAITETETYQAGSLASVGQGEGAGETESIDLLARPMSPSQLAGSVEALTGFRWVWAGYDQADNDTWGYRVQLGGLDGYEVTLPTLEPTLGAAVAQKRLAELAAAYEVEQHLGDGGDTLLGTVDPTSRPGEAAFDEALAGIWYRLTALPADEQVISDYGALWTEVEAVAGADMAWQATLTALLRDPLFVTY